MITLQCMKINLNSIWGKGQHEWGKKIITSLIAVVSWESVMTINFTSVRSLGCIKLTCSLFYRLSTTCAFMAFSSEHVIKSFCYQPYVAFMIYSLSCVDAGEIYDVSFCGSALRKFVIFFSYTAFKLRYRVRWELQHEQGRVDFETILTHFKMPSTWNV